MLTQILSTVTNKSLQIKLLCSVTVNLWTCFVVNIILSKVNFPILPYFPNRKAWQNSYFLRNFLHSIRLLIFTVHWGLDYLNFYGQLVTELGTFWNYSKENMKYIDKVLLIHQGIYINFWNLLVIGFWGTRLV